MENVLSREVWSAPRHTDAIQMDNERAQQVKYIFIKCACHLHNVFILLIVLLLNL